MEEKIKYFVYIRKSSDREDAQMLSLPAQKRSLDEFIKRKKLNVVGYFEESASAYTKGRKKFDEMISQIEEGKANGILVYHLTRIARNSFDGGNVIYMMDEEKIKEIRTPEKAYYSSISDDKFMMQIHFAMAKKSSDETSQFVKRDIQSKLLKGEYPISAPVGYLNLDKFGRISGTRYELKKQELIENALKKEKRNFKRIEQDPFLAPVIRKIFEFCASGNYSLNNLREESFEMGLKGARSNKMLGKSTLQAMLSNPFYHGAILWQEEIREQDELPKETRHIEIIDKKLFDKAQEVLHSKSRPRPQTHIHKYTELFVCGECGGMITAEIQKGRTYYRCTKKKKVNKVKSNCSQPSLREDRLEKQIQEKIKEYVIPEKFIKWALDVLSKNNNQEQKQIKMILAGQRKQLTQIESSLSQLLKFKISSNNQNEELLSDEEYLKQKKELLEEKRVIKDKIEATEQNSENWLEQCEQFFDFTLKAEEKWVTGTREEKRLIISLMFGSNPTLKDGKLLIKAKKPFFEKTKLRKTVNWRGRPDSNRRPSA